MPREAYPQCGSSWYNRHGHIHTSKQNHRCKVGGRAFVLTPEKSVIPEEQRMLNEPFLLERLSLRGICRTVGVSLQWLLQVMGTRFQSAPEDLQAKPAVGASAGILQRLEAELAELWSCVGKQANRLWVWIAMDAVTRQVIAFYVENRSQTSAEHLWANLPAVERKRARDYTSHYTISEGVTPPAQHCALAKLARTTTHRERLNCTLRQLVSRLVRSTLSFSKNLATHSRAIKSVICHYHLTKSAALPEQHHHTAAIMTSDSVLPMGSYRRFAPLQFYQAVRVDQRPSMRKNCLVE